MEAKKISQKTVKNMINSNTTLLHIGNFETEALTEFWSNMNYLERGAEACDVTIRCYLLDQAISEVLDEEEEEE